MIKDNIIDYLDIKDFISSNDNKNKEISNKK